MSDPFRQLAILFCQLPRAFDQITSSEGQVGDSFIEALVGVEIERVAPFIIDLIDPGTGWTKCRRRDRLFDLAIPVTVDEVIVDHPDGLHVRVHDRRADEAETTLFQVAAERI